ncbi:unnamed protein product [Rhizoctonia solani]|uniref:Uncharacterized protein n=1 Tax=Rhizoctonia solani TaxID=456999 RepID=A0A8H3CSS9_9AGAM|nr:unnamed protein product [Rhizoctonia solani]
MLVLAIAFASTRFIHLVQYLRVLYYARSSTGMNQVNDKSSTNKSGTDPQVSTRPWIECIPPQLKFITNGLLICNPMFITVLVISSLPFGQTITGASNKLGLWFGGFLVEPLSHLSIPAYRWVIKRIRLLNGAPVHGQESGSGSKHGGNSNISISSGYELPLSPGMNLYERLQTVTTIIVGEGINGIAGILSAAMVAPGAGRAVVVNVISAACTIWFIAYIYFEGPKGDKAPQTKSLRYILWLILHLPFPASTVLLLIGIKNQFLLTGFSSALFDTTTEFNINFREQLDGVTSEPPLEKQHRYESIPPGAWDCLGRVAAEVWSLRLSLTMAPNAFKVFNKGDDDIINSLKPNITEYYNNTTLVLQDLDRNRQRQPQNETYFKILSQLLDGTLQSTRCIIAFAGLILMSLSLQDLIHSAPRDRYQWGVILSRFLMGIVLCLLLLLNIGKYQALFVPVGHEGQRAGVFLWLEKFWVSPTIAIAYAVQFFVEIALSRFAKRSTKKATEAAAIAEETEKEIDARDKVIPMTDSPWERALV